MCPAYPRTSRAFRNFPNVHDVALRLETQRSWLENRRVDTRPSDALPTCSTLPPASNTRTWNVTVHSTYTGKRCVEAHGGKSLAPRATRRSWSALHVTSTYWQSRVHDTGCITNLGPQRTARAPREAPRTSEVELTSKD